MSASGGVRHGGICPSAVCTSSSEATAETDERPAWSLCRTTLGLPDNDRMLACASHGCPVRRELKTMLPEPPSSKATRTSKATCSPLRGAPPPPPLLLLPTSSPLPTPPPRKTILVKVSCVKEAVTWPCSIPSRLRANSMLCVAGSSATVPTRWPERKSNSCGASLCSHNDSAARDDGDDERPVGWSAGRAWPAGRSVGKSLRRREGRGAPPDE